MSPTDGVSRNGRLAFSPCDGPGLVFWLPVCGDGTGLMMVVAGVAVVFLVRFLRPALTHGKSLYLHREQGEPFVSRSHRSFELAQPTQLLFIFSVEWIGESRWYRDYRSKVVGNITRG
jgi:hypothetical protein